MFLLRLKPDTICCDAIVQNECEESKNPFNQFVRYRIDWQSLKLCSRHWFHSQVLASSFTLNIDFTILLTNFKTQLCRLHAGSLLLSYQTSQDSTIGWFSHIKWKSPFKIPFLEPCHFPFSDVLISKKLFHFLAVYALEEVATVIFNMQTFPNLHSVFNWLQGKGCVWGRYWIWTTSQ